MDTFKKETQDENDVVSEKNGANKTTIMATEAERQSGLDDTSVSKPEVSEPYIATMENYLLAHFFFIFAASFILGVIFLHSSLSFWSWQVYDDVPPFGVEHSPEVHDGFSYNEGKDFQHRSQFTSFNDVLKAVLSPNMTVSMAR